LNEQSPGPDYLSAAAWRKSSHSGPNGCVEVAILGPTIAVRDSKDRVGPVLVFDPHEWKAFLSGVRDGEFDLPS
jgi:Domain of unknown function (DUF397)